MNQVMKTGEIAKACEVSVLTVAKWIDSGLLKGFRVPGSTHRRVLREDFEAFAKKHSLPTIIPVE